MPIYALLLEYDGTPFAGWQRQDGVPSVQQLIEEAAAPLNRGQPGATIVAGRTDSGVHATAQVAQITVDAVLPPQRLRDALNARMRPHPVAVLAAAVAPDGWNARFSAIRRGYRYRILNRPARPALEQHRIWHVPRQLNVEAMHTAAQSLLGRHDFTSFRASTCQAKEPWRTLDRLDAVRLGDDVEVTVEARSFLHHQVRNLVGTLVQVGLGRHSPEWPRAVLEARNRGLAGQTAPAAGLCLTFVRYPDEPEWC